MKAFIRPKSLFALAVVCGTTALLLAEPAWWVQRGVRDPAKDPSDFAVLNQGQLKNLARAARDEMNARLPGGAGAEVEALVSGWASAAGSSKDYAVVNAGQLKAVAKPFYDRLIAAGHPVGYPWSVATGDDSSYAVVNIGQAKQVFGFSVMTDTDGDGMSDDWETRYFGSLGRDGHLDADGDGVSDLDEFLRNLNPAVWDTNGNLIADSAEGSAQNALLVQLVVYTPIVGQ